MLSDARPSDSPILQRACQSPFILRPFHLKWRTDHVYENEYQAGERPGSTGRRAQPAERRTGKRLGCIRWFGGSYDVIPSRFANH